MLSLSSQGEIKLELLSKQFKIQVSSSGKKSVKLEKDLGVISIYMCYLMLQHRIRSPRKRVTISFMV